MHTSANEQTLTTHRPGLIRLARSLVGSEAEDVVQDAYLAASDATGIRSPGAWLRGTVRRISSKRHRSRARRTARERVAARTEVLPATDEIAAAVEEQRRVLRLLQGLPAHQKRALWLRYFEDLPPRRIAEQLELPVPTVKSHLRRGLQQLRLDLDAEHGANREKWMAALAPLARAPAAAAATGLLALGLLALLAIAVVGVGWWALDPLGSREKETADTLAMRESRPESEERAALEGRGSGRQAPPTPAPTPAPAPVESPHPAALLVRGDFISTPFRALRVTVTTSDGEQRETTLQERGAALIEDLAPGHALVTCETPTGVTATDVRVQLRPGLTWNTEIEIYAARSVRGRVIAASGGSPIPGARVEAVVGHRYPLYDQAGSASGWRTRSGADGSFELTRVPAGKPLLLLADAPGLQTSEVYAEPDAATPTTIRLEAGGALTGRVLLPSGTPAAGAHVFLCPPVHGEIRAWLTDRWPRGFAEPPGKTEVIWHLDPQNGEVGPVRPPWILAAKTDEDGRYALDHVELDYGYLATARLPGYLPAEETRVVVMQERRRATLDLTLRTAGSLRLRIVDAAGEPQPGIAVYTDEQPLGPANAEGIARFDRLPVGTLSLWIRQHEVGVWRGEVEITSNPAKRVVKLEPGRTISGRALDAEGQPLDNVGVYVKPKGFSEGIRTTTGPDGSFSVPNLPEGTGTLQLWRRGGPQFDKLEAIAIPSQDLEIRAKPMREPLTDATITLTVVPPKGRPVPEQVRVGLGFGHEPTLAQAFKSLAADERWVPDDVDYPNSATIPPRGRCRDVQARVPRQARHGRVRPWLCTRVRTRGRAHGLPGTHHAAPIAQGPRPPPGREWYAGRACTPHRRPGQALRIPPLPDGRRRSLRAPASAARGHPYRRSCGRARRPDDPHSGRCRRLGGPPPSYGRTRHGAPTQTGRHAQAADRRLDPPHRGWPAGLRPPHTRAQPPDLASALGHLVHRPRGRRCAACRRWFR